MQVPTFLGEQVGAVAAEDCRRDAAGNAIATVGAFRSDRSEPGLQVSVGGVDVGVEAVTEAIR